MSTITPKESGLIEGVRIVLVEPGIGRNVGSVCRAMKTMGITELYIVRGDAFDRDHAKTTSVHAEDILDHAVYTDSLEEALRGTILSAGITRRRGKWRKYFAMDVADFAEKTMATKGGLTAAVFGSEKTGLSDEDLALCTMAVRIPSSDLFPSLNLSHAVQIVTYELYKAHRAGAGGGYSPVPRERVEEVAGEAITTLENIGFFKITGPEDLSIFLRDIFSRAALSEREAKRLQKVFKKIDGLFKKISG